jgi:serine/threonine protein kinase/Tol biopolymer transport system component
MVLAAGTRLGPYEILSFIGAGAMGVVYRARDTRLGRDVAIKLLPPAFARDPDRLARFDREARAVAAINHPNILSVHDIGSADVNDGEHGTVRAAYLITELLDGETLRERLAHGPLAPRKAADVATQVARGLSAAHDRGIVHRDLKPENIVLLRDGHVKILDFGLAKQSTPAGGSDEQQTMAATDAGTVLGTVGYMAPEQVRGEPADARSDLFALGAVLHELASGQRAFRRPTAAETMTAILREDPADLAAPPANVPPGLARVIRHALEKDPHDRFQSARDFAFALQSLNDAGSSGAQPSVPAESATSKPPRRRELLAWLIAGAFAASAVVIYWWPPHTAVLPSAAVVFSPTLAWWDPDLKSPAVSPDGTRIAFVARDRAGAIVIRRLDAIQPLRLKGTEGVRTGGVFWSPDGRSLGFFAGGKLKTVEVSSGKIAEIASAPSAYGGAWGPDGTIVFSPDERSPIYRVSAGGGEAVPVTSLDPVRKDEAHRWPQFLPDGRHFVFMPWTLRTTTRTIQVASLDGGPTRSLFNAPSAAVVAGNCLLYVREAPASLMAQPFNPTTLELDGRPVEVVDDNNVEFMWATGYPMMSASSTTLVYTTGKLRRSQLTWFSRTGRVLGTLGEPDVYYDPALSPDGATLAIERSDPQRGTTDLWTVDLSRGAFSRLTSTPGFESVATWSHDGQRIAFGSDPGSGPKVFQKNASGTGAEEVLVTGRMFPSDWSRDGKYLLLMTDGGATRRDVWVYDAATKTASPLLTSSFNEWGAVFSPDGKWLAYMSDETGAWQVYVRSFPDGAIKIPISTDGGAEPSWRRDGRELFYLAADGTLTAVEVRPNGNSLAVAAAQPLFQMRVDPAEVLRNYYVVSNDGQKVLVMSPLVAPGASPLVGVLNWMAGLTGKQ